MKYLILIIMALSATAKADKCSDLGRKFTENRFAMTVGQLDDFRLCVTDLMRAKIEEPKQEAIMRSIDRSFSKDGE